MVSKEGSQLLSSFCREFLLDTFFVFLISMIYSSLYIKATTIDSWMLLCVSTYLSLLVAVLKRIIVPMIKANY